MLKQIFRFDNAVKKCYSSAKKLGCIASDFGIMMNKSIFFVVGVIVNLSSKKQQAMYKLSLVFEPQSEDCHSATCLIFPELITESDITKKLLLMLQMSWR